MSKSKFFVGDDLRGLGAPQLRVGPISPQHMDSVSHCGALTYDLCNAENKLKDVAYSTDGQRTRNELKIGFSDFAVKSASLVIPLKNSPGQGNLRIEASQQNVVNINPMSLFAGSGVAKPTTTDVTQFELGSGLTVTAPTSPSDTGVSNIPAGTGYHYLGIGTEDYELIGGLVGYTLVIKAIDTDSNIASASFWLPGVKNPYTVSLEDTTKYGYIWCFAASPYRTASISGASGIMGYDESVDSRDFELFYAANSDVTSMNSINSLSPGATYNIGSGDEATPVKNLALVAKLDNVKVEVLPVFAAQDCIPGLMLSIARDGARFTR